MPQTPKPISQILVPMDFSECSRRALRFATRLVASSDAQLHILSVCDDPMLMASSTDQEFRDDYMENMSAKFADLVDAAIQEQFRPVMSVRVGTAYREIETYAEEKGIELIVLGAIGRSPLADIILGSVASHVIRNACCPVLTVK